MKILYIAVHYYNNENKWRTETFIDSSFNKNNVETIKIDYRQLIKNSGREELKKTICRKSFNVDLVFLQRGDRLSPDLCTGVKAPIILWSTEPINLKSDIDLLLKSDIFSWVFVHTYSCLKRIEKEFIHLKNKTSVIHNAISEDKFFLDVAKKDFFAIFNRSLSFRRRWWLWPSRKCIKIIKGRFGDAYYSDLSRSLISVNIHYTSKNLDDFETGIFEAMASGCVIVSEKLYSKTLKDLNMNDAIIQVSSRKELKSTLKYLQLNPEVITQFQKKSKIAIQKNTWTHRVEIFKNKFEEILLLK